MSDLEAELAADDEERRRAHAGGEHTFCGGECEDVISSEQLRNAILCRAIPGSDGMLNELLRRHAAQVRAEVLREVLAAIEDPQQRRGLGWESARDIVQHLINDTEEKQK